MDAGRIEDLVHRGRGRAGRALGGWCEAYRPAAPGPALAPRHLVLRLPAAFAPPGGQFGRGQAHGQLLWQGLFDAAYTRVGDYLLRRESRAGAADGGVWFIAAQQTLLPPVCVRATRVVEVRRAAAPALPGVGRYGGAEGPPEAVLAAWPAGVIEGGLAAGEAGLPDGARAAGWTVLLPRSAPELRAGDVMEDDLGRRGVVAAAGLSDLGWRLSVRQAAM